MLAKSPRARYDRMAELIGELQDLQADVDSGSRTVQRSGRKKQEVDRRIAFRGHVAAEGSGYFCDGIAKELCWGR